MTLRVGCLCSGYVGIELALKMEFGETELVFVSEFEKDPSKILQYHYQNHQLYLLEKSKYIYSNLYLKLYMFY